MDINQVYMTKAIGAGRYECYGRNYEFLGRLDEQGMRGFRDKREATEFWKAYRGGTNSQGEVLVGDATWWKSPWPCGHRAVAVPHVWRTGLS